MAQLPPQTPELPRARVPLRTRSSVSDEIVEQRDSPRILDELRAKIAAGTQPTDAILGTIAVATRALTGASGAAIAMPHEGTVVCVGRSGEIAPELGARLNVDSGISGECLRTGTILRCDDASRDFHVDPEVCRQRGLQSIAVVPLRGQHGRVGVLEAFSTESYAFTDDHMELLGRLAGLAEAAWARGSGTENSAKTEALPTDEESQRANASAALARVGEALTTGLYEEPQAERKWRYKAIASLSVLFLVLVSVFVWRAWYGASIASNSTHPAPVRQVAPAPSAEVAAGVGLTWKPSAPRAISRPNRPLAARAAQSVAEVEISDVSIWQPPESLQPTDRANVTGHASSDSTPSADDVPRIASSGAGQIDLGSVLSASPALPKLGNPISQGIAGGILIHKVQPTYPAEARQLRLQGNVILEATITVQGQIEDLKLISGPALLAKAAINAVGKWRYTPYLLNGQPVSKQVRITVSFLGPQ
jgi:TonB family protein